MMTLWLFLKAINPRTWIIMGLVAAVGYGGVRLYDLGIAHERTAARAEILEADKADAQKERDQYQAAMEQAQKTEQSAIAAVQAANSRVAALDVRLANARQSQTAAVAQVSSLSDPQLFGDITKRIGKRAIGDLSPTFSIPELREIDVRLVQVPYLQDQLGDLSDKVDALQQKSSAQDQDIVALKTERATLFTYAAQLHEHYAKAYALAQPHVSLFVRIVSLGMKHTRPLNVPAPEAIPLPAQ
jgi:hypothetical protein